MTEIKILKPKTWKINKKILPQKLAYSAYSLGTTSDVFKLKIQAFQAKLELEIKLFRVFNPSSNSKELEIGLEKLDFFSLNTSLLQVSICLYHLLRSS